MIKYISRFDSRLVMNKLSVFGLFFTLFVFGFFLLSVFFLDDNSKEETIIISISSIDEVLPESFNGVELIIENDHSILCYEFECYEDLIFRYGYRDSELAGFVINGISEEDIISGYNLLILKEELNYKGVPVKIFDFENTTLSYAIGGAVFTLDDYTLIVAGADWENGEYSEELVSDFYKKLIDSFE